MEFSLLSLHRRQSFLGKNNQGLIHIEVVYWSRDSLVLTVVFEPIGPLDVLRRDAFESVTCGIVFDWKVKIA